MAEAQGGTMDLLVKTLLFDGLVIMRPDCLRQMNPGCLRPRTILHAAEMRTHLRFADGLLPHHLHDEQRATVLFRLELNLVPRVQIFEKRAL